MSDSQPTISVVIKAKNEAERIGDCLESLKGFATETIVVNDLSEDDTADIARRMGARVIDAESRDGFIDELDKIGFLAAAGDWILRIDADERMTGSLADALKKAAQSKEHSGVCFARKNIMFGGWARHGGWFRNDQLRFFRADAWDHEWDTSQLHSQVPVRGKVLVLPLSEGNATVHEDYETIDQFIHRTLRLYSRTDARVAHRAGKRFSVARAVAKPVRRFLGRYLLRQGFRDGWRGLVLAGLLACYDFCIEANLWDIQRNADPSEG